MPRHVRAYVPGGTFFFTVALLERRKRLLVEHVDPLRGCLAQAQRARPFRVDAIAVMPDRLHCPWTLPPGDADCSRRWRAIKAGFSRGMAPGEWRPARRLKKDERGIWQRRFREHDRPPPSWHARGDAPRSRHVQP